MSTTPSLDCRMLAAASAAYYIDGTGNFTPPTNDPVYNSVLWSAAPTPVAAHPLGNEDIDACLVGTTTDGLTVVSCRGTLLLSDPPTAEEILDWVQDILLMGPYPAPSSWGADVMVHPGWWDAVVNITPGMNQTLGTLSSDATLIFTGHSKGGPMATLAAMQYAVNNPAGPKPSVYTYASPHPGNQNFANVFEGMGLKQTRYENYIDIAPLFPPTPDVVSQLITLIKFAEDFKKIDAIWASVLTGLLNGVSNWNYAAVGTGYYISSSGVPGPLNTQTQFNDLASAIEAGNYSGIAAAHCHSCPAPPACTGGYMQGVCASTGLCGS